MTDQELFDKLKRDGETRPPFHCNNCGYLLQDVGKACEVCGLFRSNPNFDTWEGFGWMWERASEKEWWISFLDLLQSADLMDWGDALSFQYIHPTRFKEALKEYLEEK